METLLSYENLLARQSKKPTFWTLIRDIFTRTKRRTIFREVCTLPLYGAEVDGYVVIQASTNLNQTLLKCFATTGNYTATIHPVKLAMEFPESIPIFEKFGYSYLP